jgi:Rrf2 family protein
MKMSEGVEWGMHCCVLLAVVPDGATLPAARLAEFHSVPAAYLSKHLQALSRSGIVESVPGKRGGYRLARAPEEITLLEVVEAIEGADPAFRCSEIRQRGPTARPPGEYRGLCGIARAMQRAEEAWRAELRSTTIGDLVRTMLAQVPPKAMEKGTTWFEEVLR